FIITIIFILLTDLLIGVSVGLLFAIYFIIQNNFREEFKYTSAVRDGTNSALIKLNSNVTFLNKVEIKKLLDEIPEGTQLTIDGADVNYIDFDVLEIINEFKTKAKDRDIELTLIDIEDYDVTAHR